MIDEKIDSMLTKINDGKEDVNKVIDNLLNIVLKLDRNFVDITIENSIGDILTINSMQITIKSNNNGVYNRMPPISIEQIKYTLGAQNNNPNTYMGSNQQHMDHMMSMPVPQPQMGISAPQQQYLQQISQSVYAPSNAPCYRDNKVNEPDSKLRLLKVNNRQVYDILYMFVSKHDGGDMMSIITKAVEKVL